MEPSITKDARIGIQIEYIEMPHLSLTLVQAQRLCDLTHDVCDAAFASLVASGFLSQALDGSFLRRGIGLQTGTIPGPRALATGL